MYGGTDEIALLLICLWCGSALGIVYDILGAVRSAFGRIVGAALDLLFSLSFFCLTAFALYYFDSGRLRGFDLPAIGLGFVFWRVFPGAFLSEVVRAVKKRRSSKEKRPGKDPGPARRKSYV